MIQTFWRLWFCIRHLLPAWVTTGFLLFSLELSPRLVSPTHESSCRNTYIQCKCQTHGSPWLQTCKHIFKGSKEKTNKTKQKTRPLKKKSIRITEGFPRKSWKPEGPEAKLQVLKYNKSHPKLICPAKWKRKTNQT